MIAVRMMIASYPAGMLLMWLIMTSTAGRAVGELDMQNFHQGSCCLIILLTTSFFNA